LPQKQNHALVITQDGRYSCRTSAKLQREK
jgi:hypothetical protein